MERNTDVMEYQSNINEVVLNLKGKLLSLQDISQLQRLIATDLLASNVRRIHTDGKNVFGQPIGRYSRKPLYINPKNSPKKFAPRGKKGKTTFRNGKVHKDRYFENGYLGFRTYIGRGSTVNLNLSGRLMRELGIDTDGKSYFVGFRNPYGSEVGEGVEKHFKQVGKLYGITQQDSQRIQRTVDTFIEQKMNKK